MKKTLLFALLAIVLFSACKKDDKVATPVPTLQARWTLQTTVIKEYINAVLINTTSIPGNSSTIDFQSNGNLVVTNGSSITSSPYTLLTGSKVQFLGDVYDIQNLTVSGVVLFRRDDYSAGEYEDVFITLTK